VEEQLMKVVCPAVAFTAVVMLAGSALAQTAAGPSGEMAGPTVNMWYGGVSTGVAAVDKAGALLSGELGIRTWKHLDLSLEGGWFQNVATQRRSDLAGTLSTFLQQTQGGTATSSVEVPSQYFSINARWVFENQRRLRPYVLGGFGAARVSVNSTFTLNGADVSGSLGQFGVTLGSDLTGHSSHPAFTGGGGVVMPFGKWYTDAGVRVTSIQTDSQSTNVVRLNIGVGVRY
jgi:opacity protein-like surface antigen